MKLEKKIKFEKKIEGKFEIDFTQGGGGFYPVLNNKNWFIQVQHWHGFGAYGSNLPQVFLQNKISKNSFFGTVKNNKIFFYNK